jgi:hypothetical protein
MELPRSLNHNSGRSSSGNHGNVSAYFQRAYVQVARYTRSLRKRAKLPLQAPTIDDAAVAKRRAEGYWVWLRERARMTPACKAFFVSEQRKPLPRSSVNLSLRKYSAAALLSLLADPHILRHACGFALADQGADTRLIQDYLGHLTIQHTVKYTATNPARSANSWTRMDGTFGPSEDIKQKVMALARRDYENDPAIITAKVLMR